MKPFQLDGQKSCPSGKKNLSLLLLQKIISRCITNYDNVIIKLAINYSISLATQSYREDLQTLILINYRGRLYKASSLGFHVVHLFRWPIIPSS